MKEGPFFLGDNFTSFGIIDSTSSSSVGRFFNLRPYNNSSVRDGDIFTSFGFVDTTGLDAVSSFSVGRGFNLRPQSSSSTNDGFDFTSSAIIYLPSNVS